MASPSPEQLLLTGCETDDAAQVARAIDQDPSLTDRALEDALIANASAVISLLIARGAPVTQLAPNLVTRVQQRDTLAALISAGWDINQRTKYSPSGAPLLWQVSSDATRVRWCLAHGAHVTPVDQDPSDLEDVITCPPVLEQAAQHGSLATFKLLREAGAPLGRRTLHWAAVAAGGRHHGAARAERMELVRYLVEELGADVNGLDVEPGQKLPNHYGAPLGYVAHRAPDPAEVTRYLIDRGAEPGLRDCWGHDPRQTGSEQFKKVVEEYESQRNVTA